MPAPLPAGADCRYRPAPEAQPEGEDRGGAAPGAVAMPASSEGAGAGTYDRGGLLIGARQTNLVAALEKRYAALPASPVRAVSRGATPLGISGGRRRCGGGGRRHGAARRAAAAHGLSLGKLRPASCRSLRGLRRAFRRPLSSVRRRDRHLRCQLPVARQHRQRGLQQGHAVSRRGQPEDRRRTLLLPHRRHLPAAAGEIPVLLQLQLAGGVLLGAAAAPAGPPPGHHAGLEVRRQAALPVQGNRQEHALRAVPGRARGRGAKQGLSDVPRLAGRPRHRRLRHRVAGTGAGAGRHAAGSPWRGACRPPFHHRRALRAEKEPEPRARRLRRLCRTQSRRATRPPSLRLRRARGRAAAAGGAAQPQGRAFPRLPAGARDRPRAGFDPGADSAERRGAARPRHQRSLGDGRAGAGLRQLRRPRPARPVRGQRLRVRAGQCRRARAFHGDRRRGYRRMDAACLRGAPIPARRRHDAVRRCGGAGPGALRAERPSHPLALRESDGGSRNLPGNFSRGPSFTQVHNTSAGDIPLSQRGILAEGAAQSIIEEVDGLVRPGLAAAGIAVAPAARPASIAYFGPDLGDPVVRRRVAQWRYAGFRVLPFAFSRNSDARIERGEFVDLGHVMPLSRARRAIPLALAALRLVAERRVLAGIDLFVARNLDIALLALFARWAVGSSAPVVYEVLDINSCSTEIGWSGGMLRRMKKWVLARANLLVLSSPYFGTDYYQKVLEYRRPWFLLENKIPRWVRLERLARTAAKKAMAAKAASPAGKRPWRIGWFGYLDDQKSWDILRLLAQRLPEDVAVHVRGRPYTNFNMARFLADVEQLDNVTYGGPFRNPEDLAEVYDAVDIVWSIDCNFPTGNSKWLLTNGLYEAGYFAKPALGLGGTAVGEFLATYGSGWCLSEPLAENLLDFVAKLTREEYDAKRKTIAGLSPDIFVETDEIERLWTLLQGGEGRRALPARESPALP